MVGTLFVSAVGAAIGGGIIAYLAYQLGQKRHAVPADKRDDGPALLEGFSLDVWRLYISVVCGSDVPRHQLAAASERGLFLVSRFRGAPTSRRPYLPCLECSGRPQRGRRSTRESG